MTRKFTFALATLLAFSVVADDGDPLHGIVIGPAFLGASCARNENFGDWVDADHDGEDTRQEVLAAESWVPVARDAHREVSGGLWVGPYAGFVTRDPADLDIDHMVPLCEAWASGAHAWSAERRVEYANSLATDHHLIATWKSTNRSKGKKDPAGWLPPNRAYWCTYLRHWVAIKRDWGLSMDPDEEVAVKRGLQVCARYAKRDHLAGRH